MLGNVTSRLKLTENCGKSEPMLFQKLIPSCQKKHTSKYKKRRQSARQARRHRRYTDAGVSQQSREHLTDKLRHNQHRSCDEELSRHGRDDPSGDVH